MSEFRILDSNKFFATSYTLTASSEATGFPVENLQNHLRSKVWRSSGNFVITTANRKIDFNDGSGAVVGTLTTGTYTASALAAEIKTRMDTAGSLVHTISYSTTTGLWTISVPAGTFSLLWQSGANTASSVGTAIGFSLLADDTGTTTYTGDTLAIHTEEWVKLDLGAAANINSFALLFDAVDGCLLSGSATVKIQGNASDSWATPSVDVTVTKDSTYDVYTYRWASSQNYRWWRILITDVANTNLSVELGIAFLSLATQLNQLPSIGFTHTLVDLSKGQDNDYGNEFFDEYPSRREFTFNHTALTAADLETLYLIYKNVGKVTPICLWLDPGADLYDKDRFFVYGRLRGEFKATNNFYTFFDHELTLVEAL